MVDRPGITVTEIAEKYRRSRSRVANYWVRDPQWRDRVRVVGKRGRASEYDPDDVHALLREWVWLPPENSDVDPERLLTLPEIADYAGIDYATVRSDASPGKRKSGTSRNILGEPDAVRDGERMWRRSTVDDRYWARQKR